MALLVIIYFALGASGHLGRGLFYRVWWVEACWGFIVLWSLYNVYRAFKRT